MTSPLDLTGSVIFITGGAQGIGEATARLCAERGATVVIADFKADIGNAAAEKMRADGLNVDFVATDVRDPAQVEAAVNYTVSTYGKLNGVLCAAGILLGPWLQPEDFPIDDFVRTLDVNIKGVFLTSRAAAPHLEKQKGVFVVIASGAGVIGGSSSLAYGASKGGANGLGMTLENHLRPRGIRVNVICPGNIVTEMKLSVDIARAQLEGRPEQDAIDYADQHYGMPIGVARVIAFMLSPEADYLRGTLFTR